MAPGVSLGFSFVDTKPISKAELKRRIQHRKKCHGWSKVLGVWEERYRKVEL
jgi:hypothetical protein